MTRHLSILLILRQQKKNQNQNQIKNKFLKNHPPQMKRMTRKARPVPRLQNILMSL